MNEDRTIPLPLVATVALWVVTLGILIAAWVVALTGPQEVAMMLGFTFGLFLGGSVVSSVFCAARRTRSLLRTVHTLNGSMDRPPELRPL